MEKVMKFAFADTPEYDYTVNDEEIKAGDFFIQTEETGHPGESILRKLTLEDITAFEMFVTYQMEGYYPLPASFDHPKFSLNGEPRTNFKVIQSTNPAVK